MHPRSSRVALLAVAVATFAQIAVASVDAVASTPDGTRVTASVPDGTRVTDVAPDGTRVTGAPALDRDV